jgi:hypothetical protein
VTRNWKQGDYWIENRTASPSFRHNRKTPLTNLFRFCTFNLEIFPNNAYHGTAPSESGESREIYYFYLARKRDRNVSKKISLESIPVDFPNDSLENVILFPKFPKSIQFSKH